MIKDTDKAKELAEKVKEKGGRAYYVGGYVRDKLRGVENKDIDIEVHGITPNELEEILDSLGERISIGESFGIYNLKGYSIDIAMPRKEEQIGLGHRDFEVTVNPNIGTYKAALRRDFTINSLMQDVLSGEIIDHFGGIDDLKKGIIRRVNTKTFQEDALRVLRAAQFAARFGFEVDDDTLALCRTMDLSNLAKERVFKELEKALLKSDKPSIFFETLRKMDKLDTWFLELKNLIAVEQEPKYHKEGDVWTHTMMVLDAAVLFRENVSEQTGFMLSCVTHDFGKAVCTEMIDGAIHAYAHEIKGLPLAEAFMKRITNDKKLIEYVLNITKNHMRPNVMAENKSSVKATNKLFDTSVEPEALIYIAVSDGLGKISNCEYHSCENFMKERLSVYREYMMRPYVMGRDLIDAGILPSEQFTDYLEYAHKLRLAGVKKEDALRQTLAMARKKRL